MAYQRSRLIAALLAMTSPLVACDHDEDVHEFDRINGRVSRNVPALLNLAGGFDTLLGHAQATNVDDTLADAAPDTVFAPVDDAFAGWPEGRVEDLGSAGLTSVLRYHVAPGRLVFADPAASPRFEGLDVEMIEAGDPIDTLLAGDTIVHDVTGEGLVLNGIVRVLGYDALATNGIVHAVDGVLLPNNAFPGTIAEALAAYPIFAPLAAAAEEAELTETLAGAGPLTLFAPSAAAWSDVAVTGEELAATLTYHVADEIVDGTEVAAAASITTLGGVIDVELDDGDVLLDDADVDLAPATVTWIDLQCTNGIIHVIDAVLRPEDLP